MRVSVAALLLLGLAAGSATGVSFQQLSIAQLAEMFNASSVSGVATVRAARTGNAEDQGTLYDLDVRQAPGAPAKRYRVCSRTDVHVGQLVVLAATRSSVEAKGCKSGLAILSEDLSQGFVLAVLPRHQLVRMPMWFDGSEPCGPAEARRVVLRREGRIGDGAVLEVGQYVPLSDFLACAKRQASVDSSPANAGRGRISAGEGDSARDNRLE